MKPFDHDEAPFASPPFDTEAKVKKAGFLIHGLDSEGHESMIAAYNEGRLGTKYKAYQLATGTVEEGENIIEAARRETFEETGIDVKDILGGYWRDLVKNGGELDFGENGYTVPSGKYEGLNIRKISVDNPYDFTYTSHIGVEKRINMFDLEVNNIDWFRESNLLKSPDNATENCKGKVWKTTWSQINNRNYPKFNEMIDWLRSGEMPQNKSWNIGKPVPEKLYAAGEVSVVGFGCYENLGQTFARLEKDFFGGKPAKWNHRNWKEFCDYFVSDSDYSRLRQAFTKIKTALKDLNVTKDDHGVIKLDDKDFPLTFYQEGAELIRVQDYFCYVDQLRERNEYYDTTFAGKPIPPKETPLKEHWSDQKINEALSEANEIYTNAEIDAMHSHEMTVMQERCEDRPRADSQYDFIKFLFPEQYELAQQEGMTAKRGASHVERLAQLQEMHARDLHEGNIEGYNI